MTKEERYKMALEAILAIYQMYNDCYKIARKALEDDD